MIKFERITDDILRLKVPFESVYTAVFLIKTDRGAILVDAATTKTDAEDIILPAIDEIIDRGEIKYLVCTHLHGDHGGGIRYLLPHLKNMKVAAASARANELYGEENVHLVQDGDSLCGIDVLSLKGHSLDSVGLLDKRTKTVILGDAVQLYGIGRYGCGVGFPKEYRKTLDNVQSLAPEMLVASHEYYPHGSIAAGDAVNEYMDTAKAAFERIVTFVKESECTDAAEIAKNFTETARQTEPDMPYLQASTVNAIMQSEK